MNRRGADGSDHGQEVNSDDCDEYPTEFSWIQDPFVAVAATNGDTRLF